jgi:drug/metabolite transporter (DMT)-like permease
MWELSASQSENFRVFATPLLSLPKTNTFDIAGSPERCFISKTLKVIKEKLLIHRLHIVGIFLAILSGAIFTLNNCIIQWMKLDFSEIMLVRGSIQVLMFTLVLMANGYSVFPTIGENPTKTRLLVIFQGIGGGLMMICSVSCVTFMPLGDAMALLFTAPLSTMILAAIFLRHNVRLYRIVNAFLLITGAILVIQPTFIFDHFPNLTLDHHDYYYYIGAVVALSAALFDGFVNIAINYCQEVQSIVLLWWAGIGAIIFSFIGFAFDPNARMLSDEIIDIPYSHWIAYVGITLQV